MEKWARMSDPKNVPQALELIEAAMADESEPQVQFRLYTILGVFYTQQGEGDRVYVQLNGLTGELRSQELADIIRAKCLRSLGRPSDAPTA